MVVVVVAGIAPKQEHALDHAAMLAHGEAYAGIVRGAARFCSGGYVVIVEVAVALVNVSISRVELVTKTVDDTVVVTSSVVETNVDEVTVL